MYTVGGMNVVDKKLHIIKMFKPAKNKVANIADDDASTTKMIYGKDEDLMTVLCIYALSAGAGT
ncbi:MAG: hypothetical protein JXA98_08255 [Methanosarcinaceae archaeon]|nr:hypothetical protein [Methanosarcinaceae archaeon]